MEFINFFFEFLNEKYLQQIINIYKKDNISKIMKIFIQKIFNSKFQKNFFLNLFKKKKISFLKIIYKSEKKIFLNLLKELSVKILKDLEIDILEDNEISNILIKNIDLDLLINYKNEENQSFLILLVKKNKKKILKNLINLLDEKKEKKKDLKKKVNENIKSKDIYGLDLKNYLIKNKTFFIFENLKNFLSEKYLKKNKVFYSSVKILKNKLLTKIDKKYLIEKKENLKFSKIFLTNLKKNKKLQKIKKKLKEKNLTNSYKLNLEDLLIKMEFINNEENFDKMIIHINQQKIIGIDMEYLTIIEKKKKFTIFSLIQISTIEKVFIIDSLILYKKIKISLKKILEGKKILKIFHGCIWDLRILYSYLDIKINFFLDTAEIYKILFFQKISIGLNFLTKKFFNFELDKSLQRSDWNIRPLPLILKNYAAYDAIVLLPLFLCFLELEGIGLGDLDMALKKSRGIYNKIRFREEFKIDEVVYVKDSDNIVN